MASALTSAGYDSIYVGKYHMGSQRSRPGFSRSATYVGQGTYRDCEFLVDGKRVQTERWVDDVSTDYAIQFMNEERDRPFLLFLGFKAPHGPRVTPDGLESLYSEASLPAPRSVETLVPFPRKSELLHLRHSAGVGAGKFSTPEDWATDPANRRPDTWQTQLLEANGVDTLSRVQNWLGPGLADYHRQVHSVDRNVGRILAALDELALTQSTIVIYASDNGLQNGEHGLQFKRAAYESSMRIPLIIRYPQTVGHGRVTEQLVLNIDLAPTLLDLAGVAIPKDMQGASLRPLLASPAKTDGWRTAFLYEYVREWAFINPSAFAVRTDSWKLIRYPGYPGWTELFDLRSDPHEIKNLATVSEYAHNLDEMSRLLSELQEEAGPRPRAVR